jgi:hypothetical protein
MWDWLRHPLTVALVGVAITGVLVPYFARRWQNQQKALEVRAGLVADMSESAMGLMARVQVVHKLTQLTDDLSLSEERQAKLREELHRAQDSLNAERQKFEVGEAVIGTKLGAYLRRGNIPERWTTLAEALTELVDLQGSEDAVHEKKHRAVLLERLQKLDSAPVDSQSWPTLVDAVAVRKAVLIKDVLHAPWVFRTSWIPWK